MNKEDTIKAIRKSSEGFIGQENNKITEKAINAAVDSSLSALKDKNILNNFGINYCETKHKRKKFFGRVSDWIKWKSPLRGYFYKPEYVEIEVVDIFHRLWEHGSLDISEEEFNKMCSVFAGVKTFEERYPEDPYLVWDISVNIVPIKPIEYIKTDFILEK